MSSKTFPPNSFYRLNDSLFVASPEYAWVRLARNSSLLESVYAASELMAMYVYGDGEESPFAYCGPICAQDRLERFVAKCDGMHGVKNARRAVRLSVPNAASPMELELALLLSLPKSMGGYGLPKPVLNHTLKISDRERKELGIHSITIDLFWPECKYGVEYDSDEFHTGSMKIGMDSERRNHVDLAGFNVKSITNYEYRSIARMDKAVKSISKHLGVRATPSSFARIQNQQELRDHLICLRKKH